MGEWRKQAGRAGNIVKTCGLGLMPLGLPIAVERIKETNQGHWNKPSDPLG